MESPCPCPVCRSGELTSLTLMDAMSCNFCRHIFVPNGEPDVLTLADSAVALTWRWNGKRWLGVQHGGTIVGWEAGLLGAAFVLFPTMVMGFSAYLFPPLPGSPWAWFPLFWTGLTFCAHLVCVVWLAVEYYQFPVQLYLRAIQQAVIRNKSSIIN
ncbi:hypothetical protein K4A83_06485 [Spirulina subsalsa FACHB-351]|uniref:Uncharacterized protein n=1 Tax=Spirulina subsalsa FACHB-351 TaxID=234711 RepID=A0ABT3L487_9CYAN|nr:hypothetical protein [Spirulina subsalsa]MCW6035919.1 hypothetical protein [Spirulina subsalsa FACHB-351]